VSCEIETDTEGNGAVATRTAAIVTGLADVGTTHRSERAGTPPASEYDTS
jgi:hypothetical protein